MVSFQRLIAALIPVAFVFVISWFGVYTFVNGYVIKELGGKDPDWTMIAMWLVGGIIVWQLVVNELAAWVGRRNTITFALAIVGASFLALPLCRTLTWIGPLISFMGFTQAAVTGVWLPMIADVGREKPGKALAILMMVNVTVTVGALLLGGSLVEWFSYRTMFVSTGAACLICAAGFHLIAHPLERGQQTPAISLRSLRGGDVRQLSRASVLILFVALGIEPFNYLTLNSLYPNLARGAHGMSEQHISMIVALGRIPSVLSLLWLGHYIDRLNPTRWYAVMMTIVAAVVAGMGWAPTTWVLVLLYPMFYLFHGAVWASNNAAVNAAVEPRLRDVSFMLQSLIANVTVLGIGWVHTKLLREGYTLSQVFVISGAVTIVTGVLLFVLSFFTKQLSKPEVDAKELAVIENQ